MQLIKKLCAKFHCNCKHYQSVYVLHAFWGVQPTYPERLC
ncbi:unnamed protein product [Larinioides sclopetarius]|uniref:Uncharacterized protein n=1 Tax=Larinioides sclopetarius TaxID=280406 RepID=A0AAV1ZEG9_9ARAC